MALRLRRGVIYHAPQGTNLRRMIMDAVARAREVWGDAALAVAAHPSLEDRWPEDFPAVFDDRPGVVLLRDCFIVGPPDPPQILRKNEVFCYGSKGPPAAQEPRVSRIRHRPGKGKGRPAWNRYG